jgi:peroxin-5
MNPTLNMYQGNHVNNTVSEGKGKGKEREVDFEAAFAQAAASLSPDQTDTSTEDSVTGITNILDNTSLRSENSEFRQSVSFDHRSWESLIHNTRCSIWDQLQNSDLPPPKEDMTKWESEFNQLMSAQRDELDHDYGAAMQQAWDSGVGNFSVNGVNALKFNSEGMPIQGEYTFGILVMILCFLVSDLDLSERNNKHLESASSRSLLGDAKALLDQNGSLTEAALLLEGAIQSGELGDGGYEAWILLGETRNMDEREEQGMKALIEGVKRAEDGGASGVGMLVNDFINHSSKSPLISFH